MTSRARTVLSLDELRQHRTQLAEIAVRYGVQNIRVFGSVPRGETDEASDLDLVWAAAADEVPDLVAAVGTALDGLTRKQER